MKNLIVVFITGLSGSGKTTALRVLESNGFFCIDNLPANLLSALIERLQEPNSGIERIAVAIDARGRDFLSEFLPIYKKIKKKFKTRLLYFEARDDVLLSRFQAVRQGHPLGVKGNVAEGIELEKKILKPIRKQAGKIIDTSDLNIHELKHFILTYFIHFVPKQQTHISIVSFGYKYGIPIHADMVFDARFLPNPFFVEKLKKKTGMDKAVAQYVVRQEKFGIFEKKIQDLIVFVITEYMKEKRTHLTVAIGCTGGRHRSVTLSERMRVFLKRKKFSVTVTHRDLHHL